MNVYLLTGVLIGSPPRERLFGVYTNKDRAMRDGAEALERSNEYKDIIMVGPYPVTFDTIEEDLET